MRKQVKRSKQEQEYRRRYYELQKLGYKKKNTRILTHKEYLQARKEGNTNSDILEGQSRLGVRNKREAIAASKELAARNNVKYTKAWAKEHWRQAKANIESRISNGENKADVLADYGY